MSSLVGTGYTREELYQPQSSDGVISALGLSVSNGVERAISATKLSAYKFMELSYNSSRKRLANQGYDAPEFQEPFRKQAEIFEEKFQDQRTNHQILESIIGEINNNAGMGAIGGFSLRMVAGMIESFNPQELAVNLAGGVVAGSMIKNVKPLYQGFKNSRTMLRLTEAGMNGIVGGAYNAYFMNKVYDDVDAVTMAKTIIYGAGAGIAINGIARYLGGRKKIKTQKEYAEFLNTLKTGNSSTDIKINKKVGEFMSGLDAIKKAGMPRTQALNAVDNLLDQVFLLGGDISDTDIAKLFKGREHSQAFNNVHAQLESPALKPTLDKYFDNYEKQGTIAQEMSDTIMKNRVQLEELGQAKIRLEEIKNTPRRAKKKLAIERAEIEAKIKSLEETSGVKVIRKLDEQLKVIQNENKLLEADLNSRIKSDDYSFKSWLNEKNAYDNEYLELDLEQVKTVLGQDPKENFLRNTDVNVDKELQDIDNIINNKTNDNVEIKETDTNPKVDGANKAKIDNNIETDVLGSIKEFEANLPNKAELIRQWIESGCKL